jgi:hypothetical protein
MEFGGSGRNLSRFDVKSCEILAQELSDSGAISSRWLTPRYIPSSWGARPLEQDAIQRDESDESLTEADDHKRLGIGGLREPSQLTSTGCENASCRTRTYNPLIKSQLLYQLS